MLGEKDKHKSNPNLPVLDTGIANPSCSAVTSPSTSTPTPLIDLTTARDSPDQNDSGKAKSKGQTDGENPPKRFEDMEVHERAVILHDYVSTLMRVCQCCLFLY